MRLLIPDNSAAILATSLGLKLVDPCGEVFPLAGSVIGDRFDSLYPARGTVGTSHYPNALHGRWDILTMGHSLPVVTAWSIMIKA